MSDINENKAMSLSVSTSNNHNSNGVNDYYLDDAKISAIMLYQRQIFQQQQIELQKILDKKSSRNSNNNSSSSKLKSLDIPIILLSRMESQQNLSKNILEDLEITLLGIFDTDGYISLQCKLMELIVVMTRVTKVDHRALCLNIVLNHLTQECSQYFVLHGGLRLLKRWIRIAEEEDCIDELSLIIKICRNLPFDKNIVKESDIGKSIKKLLKYKSPSDKDTMKLQEAVKDVIDYWTKCLSKGTSEIKVSSNCIVPMIEHNDIIENIRGKIEERRGPPRIIATTPVASSPKAEKSSKSKVESETSKSSNTDKLESKMVVTSEKPIEVKASTEIPKQNTVPKKAPTVLAQKYSPALAALVSSASLPKPSITPVTNYTDISKNDKNFQILPDVNEIKTLSTEEEKIGSVEGPSTTRNNGVRKAFDMAAEAKRRLASETMYLDTNVDTIPTETKQIVEKNPPKPGPGGLKRKRDGTDNTSKKKSGIKWADESGGSIRMVFTFYVEEDELSKNKVGRKVDAGGSKKKRGYGDKERAMEKEAFTHKKLENMQKVIEWTKPSLLVLSIQIQDNSRNPVTSTERDIQAKRNLTSCEQVYVIEEHIPKDPSTAFIQETKMDTVPDVIPWELPGAAPSEPDIYNPTNFNYQDNYNVIPDIIYQLDEDIIRAVHEDRSVINQILYSDGSINDGGVALLRMKRNSTDQFAGYHNQNYIPPQTTFAPGFNNPPGFPQGNVSRFPQPQGNPPALPPPYNNNFIGNDPLMNFNNFNRPNVNPQMPSGNFYPGATTPFFQAQTPQGLPPPQLVPTQMIPLPPQPRPAGVIPVGLGGNNQPAFNPNAKKPRVVGKIPCQWFNTPEGCSWGERCTFAHNAIANLPTGPGNRGPTRRK